MTTIKISNTDFIQKIIKLDGEDWRLKNRPYIFPIINSNFKRNLILAARQTEKSTSLSGILLAKACLNPNFNLLYVAPTAKQVGVFSRKKIDEAFEVSKLLKKNFYPGARGFNVEEKKLKNYSTLYFRSVFHSADSARGITAHVQAHDEFQDLPQDAIPVLEACSMKKKNAQFFYTGTPKTFDNPIHTKFEISSANEWHVKCLHCGHWNRLSIENVLLDKPGLWCKKCQRDINSLFGCWVQARQSEIEGFRLPSIILPADEIDWKDVYFKMRNYSTGALMNEVFGESYDSGSKPITRDQLINACDVNRHMWEVPPDSHRHMRFFAGIDWGMGESGFTILTIGYHDTETNKFKITYVKRYVGREAEPENVVALIAKKLIEYRAFIVGADWGFGIGFNGPLKKLLSSEFTYVTYRHSVIKKFIAYDEHGETYVTNRTEVMTEMFNKLKNEFVQPFNWNEFEEFGKDYLNVNAEYSDALHQVKYVHTLPDDCCHSGIYALLSWMIVTKNIASTRYTPGEDDIEGQYHS